MRKKYFQNNSWIKWESTAMEPILTSIVAALVAGATAKAKDVASQAISDAYEGLKGIIVNKLGCL